MNRYKLVYLIYALVLIGLIFISFSSIAEATVTAGDKLYFIKKQLLWVGIGTIGFYLATKIKIDFIKFNSTWLFYGSILLLCLLFIPGISQQTLGARRWINLGPLAIQPSEIFKLSATIFFAKLFSIPQNQTIKNLIIYLGIPLVLIILEPNLSTAILITVIGITIYYLSGGEIVSLFGLSFVMVILSFVLIFSSPYRLARFNSLLNLDSDSNSTSYHSSQMILALTSGHFTGKGFANSEEKYRYLPKISTDSILAVIGEETGFIGICVIVFLYTIITLHLIKISQIVHDPFQSLFTAGVACWITFQSLINISAVAGLIPLTGIPLPLISYGGSSLVTLMFALGLVQNIVYSNKYENVKEDHHYGHPPHSRHRAN